jgi:hypothetical protein
MKKISAYLVTLVGVVAIVMGVLFILGAADSQNTVANEIAPLTISKVNSTYDQLSLGVKANPTDMSLAIQKASLSVAKSNLGVIDFVRKSGILSIVLGVGVGILGLVMVARKE